MRGRIQKIEDLVYDDVRYSPRSLDKYKKIVLDGLKYIEKYWHRLERYQEIEREVPHGPFTLVNEYGYSPEEYEEPLSVLDLAAEHLELKGFSNLLYGNVVLTTQKGLKKHGGSRRTVCLYDIYQDLVLLAVDYDPDKWSVPVLIHEFGHRLWFKELLEKERAEYIAAYGWVSKEQLQEWWELMEENNYTLRLALKKLSNPEDREELKKRWNAALQTAAKVFRTSVKGLRREILDGYDVYASGLKDAFTQYGIDDFVKPRTKRTPVTVTKYALTDPEEDFADTFMFYILDWGINDVPKSRLLKALGRDQS